MSFLYDALGNRKYLTISERTAFLLAVEDLTPPSASTFCATLAHTGARLSEVLELAPSRIDLDSGIVIIRSLKKRRNDVYRAVPVPPDLLQELGMVHSVESARADQRHALEPLWPWGRTTAWEIVKRAMYSARIHGPQATPKGLRHGFAVTALQCGVPLNIVSKWLGHANIRTTAIYADAVGDEERSLAMRMWGDLV